MKSEPVHETEVMVNMNVRFGELEVSNHTMIIEVDSEVLNRLKTDTEARLFMKGSVDEKPEADMIKSVAPRNVSKDCSAFLCTTEATLCIDFHEQNAPFIVGKRVNHSIKLLYSTRFSCSAVRYCPRSDFSPLLRMVHASEPFRTSLSEYTHSDDKKPHAFSLCDYLEYTPASQPEVLNELAFHGMKVYRSPFLQKIDLKEVDIVVDALLIQLISVQSKYDEYFRSVRYVPLIFAADALRSVYDSFALISALEVIGRFKTLTVHSRNTPNDDQEPKQFKVILLDVRAYLRHKIHCCFAEQNRLPIKATLQNLKSSIPTDINEILVDEWQHIEPNADVTDDDKLELNLLYPFPPSIFRGIAIRRSALAARDEDVEQSTIESMSVSEELLYYPFRSLRCSNAESTLVNLMNFSAEWTKEELAPYILPYIDASCHAKSKNIDDIVLEDDWTLETSEVLRANPKSANPQSGYCDDSQAFMSWMGGKNGVFPSLPKRETHDAEVNSQRDTLLEQFLRKYARRHETNKVFFTL